MYYYIFDPPQLPKEYERTAQIKELLTTLGIAGEITTPQPGRTVEQLVEQAMLKRYSTVIAVGGIQLINRVASALGQHDVVFGIIPLTEHPDITAAIGVSDWRLAAEQLKRRRWQPVRPGILNGSTRFLTPLSLPVPAGTPYHLQADGFELKGVGPGIITIAPGEGTEAAASDGLRFRFTGEPKSAGFLRRLLGSETAPADETALVLPRLQVITPQPLPVSMAGTEIAATPFTCAVQKQPLRLIVGRQG